MQVTFDCADPPALGAFWAGVLRYPAPDMAAWHERLRQLGMPEEQLDNWCRIEDPDQVRPTLFFQRVPEPKAVKNRVHLDVRAPRDGDAERQTQVDGEVARIVALGGRRIRDVTDEDGYFVVMQDPEGNEFCID